MHPVISAIMLFAIFVGISLLILNCSSYYLAQAKENLAWDKGMHIAEEIVRIAEELKNLPEGIERKYSFYLPGGTILIENRSVVFTYAKNKRVLDARVNLSKILIGKGRHTLIFRKERERILVLEKP